MAPETRQRSREKESSRFDRCGSFFLKSNDDSILQHAASEG